MDELAKQLASVRGAVAPAWSEARAERLLVGVGRLRRKRRAQRVVASGVASVAALVVVYLGSTSLGGPASRASLPPAGQPAQKLSDHDPDHGDGADRALAIAASQMHDMRTERSDHDHDHDHDHDELAALPVKLADGSRVKALSHGAAVAVENNDPKRIQLRLDAGGARFDVVPNAKRRFTVRAGSVEVAVLGTVFDVERAQGRVRVSVSRGKVRVHSAAGDRSAGVDAIVKVGESRWFDDVHPSQRAGERAESSVVAAHSAHSAHAAGASHSARAARTANVARERTPASSLNTNGAKVAPGRSARHAAVSGSREHSQDNQAEETPRAAWRSLSQSGDYEGAYRLLQDSLVEDNDTGALLDAADAARLSGHPQAAVVYLHKVLDQHRESPVAPLAAFTLGRVLLERLGQPSEAADAFATARQLAPTGSLAQDALAREVEAWSKAGRPDDAYRRARQYVDTYPKGRRLRAVQLYGGL